MLELEEELVARDLLPEVGRIAGVELYSEAELVVAASWKKGRVEKPINIYSISFSANSPEIVIS